ncbi:MAG TPA: UDP-3-O-(3-hydroxymyristoyl)glucosamine N-acyltransferase [Pyrinomonadaceae bacterium]|jgi:UDP-3-O-[3-hydroxymyristoyl] glucosamine N-acyltransferase|nr:UDP-3-O-(3-hydroxymyristoyl)glucosamine N-acyltransferase [Pyrinomonadaceae bacterium]
MSTQQEGKTAEELAALVGGRVVGNAGARVVRVASLASAGEGELAFVENEKLFEAARASRASVVVAPAGAGLEGLSSVIEVAQPKLAFALAAAALNPTRRRVASVHPTAHVVVGASLGEGVYVGAHVSVGDGSTVGEGTQLLDGVSLGERVTVGRDCVLHPNVVLYDGVSLGDRIVLHAGVVVGADGFGYVRDAGGVYHKFPQVGTVFIEDDVEIGANSCVDRGALGATRVGKGSKIDNLVQIGHNVEIGERVVIAAQTGISGSTVIESDAVIGGQVGFGDHARVLSGAVIGSQAGVLPGKIVRPGVWWGTPVQPLEEYKRLNALWGRLPRMREEIQELKRQLKELTERLEEKS